MVREKNILIVEDNPQVAVSVRKALKEEEADVITAHTAEAALQACANHAFDLVILDLGLPDGDGMEVMQDIRRDFGKIPVLMLTARDGVADRVAGLDAGADDYLVKPFAMPELLARARRILDRERAPAAELVCGDIVLDTVHRKASLAGEPLDLSPREYAVLQLLVENKGRIVARSMLAKEVWDAPSRWTPLDNVIEVCVSRVRKKLDPDRTNNLLLTVRGAGYLLQAEHG